MLMDYINVILLVMLFFILILFIDLVFICFYFKMFDILLKILLVLLIVLLSFFCIFLVKIRYGVGNFMFVLILNMVKKVSNNLRIIVRVDDEGIKY